MKKIFSFWNYLYINDSIDIKYIVSKWKECGINVAMSFAYNPNKCKFNLNGQLLHAKKLILSHPRTKEVLTFECDLPDYFKKVLSALNSKYAE